MVGQYIYIYILYYIILYILYIHIIYNITELKNNGVKLCGNLQFVSRITSCVLIQVMLIEIFFRLDTCNRVTTPTKDKDQKWVTILREIFRH